MRAALIISCAVLALSACADKKDKVFFDGNYYPSKAKHVSKDDRKSFVAEVRRTKQSLAGAREAGRHAGTTYCSDNYGTSSINWTIGPDADDVDLIQNNGNLKLAGECVTW